VLHHFSPPQTFAESDSVTSAQRAYRQRKESTLEDLRKRVSELTTTIELMNKAFSDLRGRLSSSAINESALQGLRETSVYYETLMKDVRNPSDAEIVLRDGPPAAPVGSTDPREPLSQEAIQGKNVDSWLDQSVVGQPSRFDASRNNLGMGYAMFMPTEEDEPTTKPPLEPPEQALILPPKSLEPVQPSALFDFNDLGLQFASGIDVPPPELTPPITYSFQETSFGRRLHRACIEAGYQLLLDPSRRPRQYEKVFRLSLMGRDRAKLTASMKALLTRGPHESLEFWEAPLIHVGGAGTHYPRRDPFGNMLPKKNVRTLPFRGLSVWMLTMALQQSYNLGLIGPQTLALLENAAKNNVSTDMTVEIAGYE
jgi:hypothetical protein